jgi:hypothetical protein
VSWSAASTPGVFPRRSRGNETPSEIGNRQPAIGNEPETLKKHLMEVAVIGRMMKKPMPFENRKKAGVDNQPFTRIKIAIQSFFSSRSGFSCSFYLHYPWVGRIVNIRGKCVER